MAREAFPRSVLLILLVGLVAAPVRGDEAPGEAGGGAFAMVRPTARADRILHAREASGVGVLAATARDDGEPWITADELVGRLELDVAEAYADVVPDVTSSALVAYVRSRRLRDPQIADRDLLWDAVAFLGRKRPESASNLLVPMHVEAGTVLSVLRAQCLGESLVAARRGPLSEALDALAAGATEARTLGWLTRAAALYRRAGEIAYEAYAYDRARTYLGRRLDVVREVGNPALLPYALADAAAAAASAGDLPTARAWFLEAERLLASRGDDVTRALVLTSLGTLHSTLGEYARGLTAAEQAHQLLESRITRVRLDPDPELLAQAADTMSVLGMLHGEVGQSEVAVQSHAEALRLARRSEDELTLAFCLGNLGVSLLMADRVGEATERLDEALGLFEHQRASLPAAQALGNLADALSQGNEPERAVRWFRGVRTRLHEIGDPMLLAWATGNLGTLLRRAGRGEQALKLHQEALGLATEIGARALEIEQRGQLAAIYVERGDYVQALGCAEEAVRGTARVVAGLGDQSGIAAIHARADLYDAGAVAAVRTSDLARAWWFLEAGRASALQQALGGHDALWPLLLPPALAVADQEARSREADALADWLRAVAGGVLAEIRAAVSSLDERRRITMDLADRIQREARATADLVYPRPVDVAHLQAVLAPDEAIVSYALLSQETFALVVVKDDIRVVRFQPADGIRDLARALSEAGGVEEFSPERLEQLRQTVVAPLALDDAVHTVLVSPGGALAYLPFPALLPGRRVAMVPSGSVLHMLRQARPESGVRVLGVGNPVYAQQEGTTTIGRLRQALHLRALPGTEAEVKAVADVQLLDLRATEQNLRDELTQEKERWRAIHFACHAIVNRSLPLQSALVLSVHGEDDGLLTALEVMRLPLRADLVVLSGCETGLGSATHTEGLEGLVRAFMVAGAPRVLASLRQVDDEATRAFMEAFYAAWTGGSGPAEAVRKAQDAVRGDPRWSLPKYWAAWTLWGLPEDGKGERHE